jgi:A/G-specific adenine glycosylase
MSSKFSEQILFWYSQNKRVLPWRLQEKNPYKTWISEIMLQQTTVQTTIPFFLKFLNRFPTLDALALAPLEDVLKIWQGLGYYSRARNLHTAAQLCFQNGLPCTEEEWRQLPGVGPYTSKAIMAIAFGQKAAPVDGNIRRILARHQTLQGENWKQQADQQAQILAPEHNCGDYVQGLMDLGSIICRPKAPLCFQCPLKESCRAYASGTPENWPLKVKKPIKARCFAHSYILQKNTSDPLFLICKEEQRTLLKDLKGFPLSDFKNQIHPPCLGGLKLLGSVVHVFTHIHLQVQVWTGLWKPEYSVPNPQWASLEDLKHLAFSRLMRKIETLFLSSNLPNNCL